MTEVFSNPDQVMAKFVLNIYHLKLQVCISIHSVHVVAHDLRMAYLTLPGHLAFWQFV
jgi:hypothetical protein